mgnify:FL=1
MHRLHGKISVQLTPFLTFSEDLLRVHPMNSRSEDFTCDDVGLSSGGSFTTLGPGLASGTQAVEEAEEAEIPAQEEPVITQQTEVQEPIEIPRGPDDNSEFL